MRKAMMLLAMAVCMVWVAGARAAVASPVSFHQASGEPVAGYDLFTYGKGDVLYVAPDVAFTGDNIVSAEAIRTSGGSVVKLTLSPGVAADVLVDGRVAIFVKSKLTAAADMHADAASRTAELMGLLPREAKRLANMLKAGPAALPGPMITTVSAGETDGLSLIDVYVNNVSDLRGYQVTLTATGEAGEQLELEHIWVDGSRENYVFAGLQAVTAVDMAGGRLAGALYAGTVDVSRSAYVGTYAYRATRDAGGAVNVDVQMDGRSKLVSGAGGRIPFQVEAAPTAPVPAGGIPATAVPAGTTPGKSR